MSAMPDVSSFKMAHLLAAYPSAHQVLVRHGVDPLVQCHRAATNHMTLKQVLGRTCKVDDVEATLTELEDLVNERAI